MTHGRRATGRRKQPSLRYALLLTLSLLLAACRSVPPPERHIRLRDPAPAALARHTQGPALITLWGSWCAPCLEETPALIALASDPPAGLQLVVIAVNDDPSHAKKAFSPGTPILDDPDGVLAGELGVASLPAAFLLRSGQLIARFDGPRAWNGRSARTTLARLLDEPPAVDPAPVDG